MDYKLLELHYSQLQSLWNKSKNNKYSDKRKQRYHQKLVDIITRLESEDFSILKPDDIAARFYVITFIFKSLEFLNNSTQSTIPFETVAVLEKALNDWCSENAYIIVTSLVNTMNAFSFDGYLIIQQLPYTNIQLLYKVEFEQKLVQINLPLSLSRDYLANVVLYHELGHFIDRKYEITTAFYRTIIYALANDTLTDEERADVFTYFPYLADPDVVAFCVKNNYPQLRSHIAEYFCDLFASQYIKDCSSHYLEYITQKGIAYNPSHPSAQNRIELVGRFLKSESSFVLDLYRTVTEKSTNRNLQIRFEEITSTNFTRLIPVEISNNAQLHGIFIYGWQTWLNNWDEIRTGANIEYPLTQLRVYEIINNLMEKSIGNFIIREEWEKAKTT